MRSTHALDRRPLEQALMSSLTDALAARRRTPKVKHCLRCGKELTAKGGKVVRKNRYWCDGKCSRSAHYLSFRVAAIEKEQFEGRPTRKSKKAA